jgi:hypothetical protein
MMFTRILVVLEHIQFERELCHAALQLAGEIAARIQWLQLVHPPAKSDFSGLQFLHQEALIGYGIESDITQVMTGATEDLPLVIREQLIKWCPDLLILDQHHFQDIAPLFSHKPAVDDSLDASPAAPPHYQLAHHQPGGSQITDRQSAHREFACSVMVVPNSAEKASATAVATANVAALSPRLAALQKICGEIGIDLAQSFGHNLVELH